MKDDYSRAVSMQCGTCGGSEFAFDETKDPVRCTGCGREYARDELVRENGGRIDSHLDELKHEIVADLRKDLGKIFKSFK